MIEKEPSEVCTPTKDVLKSYQQSQQKHRCCCLNFSPSECAALPEEALGMLSDNRYIMQNLKK